MRKAEVLADENQAGPVGIAKPQGRMDCALEIERSHRRAPRFVSLGGAIVAPARRKPEFDLF